MPLFIYVSYTTIYSCVSCHYLFMSLVPLLVMSLVPLFIHVSHATIFSCLLYHYFFMSLMPLFIYVSYATIYVSLVSIYLHFLCQYLLGITTMSIVNCVIERNLRLLLSLRRILRASQHLHSCTVVWNWPSYRLQVKLHLSLLVIFIDCLTIYSWQNDGHYNILNLPIFNYIFLACRAVFLTFDDKYILLTQSDRHLF
jgi:hypothetical protein